MYKILVVWVGKLILLVTRLAGNAGSAFPGLVTEKIHPNFAAKASKKLKFGSVLITGTNGKTTTAKLLRGVLESAGHKVVANRAGSNMSRGIASALLEHSDWLGRLDADVGLFEVDEAFMGDVGSKLKPTTVVVLNLLRDQLDRYGELDRTAELIGHGLKHSQSAVLNADDPLVAALASHVPSRKIMFFGANKDIQAHLPHDEILLKGKYRAKPNGSPKIRPDVRLSAVNMRAGKQFIKVVFKNNTYSTGIQLAGIYNAYNAVAALAAAEELGIGLAKASEAIKDVGPAFGRTEIVEFAGKKLQLLLVKNPAGFNQIIKTFLIGKKRLPVLMAINDNFADGRDVSWLWDVNFEQLSGQEHRIIASGQRGYDLALRLKYADIKSESELNLQRALRAFVSKLGKNQTGYIVPTYTAMLRLRQLLAKKSQVGKVWR